jgi:hypothetical protein
MNPDLDYFMARCVEDGDCMLWDRSKDRGGRPRLSIRTLARTKTLTVQPRRMVWELVNGKIPARKYVTVTCGNPACLNPDHMELIAKGEVIRRTAQHEGVKHRRRLAGLASRERSPLSMEVARYIRASDKSGAQLSRELNIPATTISAIRLYKRWKDLEGNPFAGLYAANDSNRRAA